MVEMTNPSKTHFDRAAIMRDAWKIAHECAGECAWIGGKYRSPTRSLRYGIQMAWRQARKDAMFDAAPDDLKARFAEIESALGRLHTNHGRGSFDKAMVLENQRERIIKQIYGM